MLLCVGLSGCMRASPPLPSFSRDHEKARPSQPERVQIAIEDLERCVEASRLDVGETQFQERARLLCRQARRSLLARLDQDEPSTKEIRETMAGLELSLGSESQARPKIAELQLELDELHNRNDEPLLNQLAKSEAKWKITGMQLRLRLRAWRRCKELQAERESACEAPQKASQEALGQFAAALDTLLTAHPFGARSFRQCAERSFLPQPTEARGIAQVAPGSAEALRSCERMAARIRWRPI